MLLEFTIDNFLSFENKEVFTLQPGRGTLKKEHKIEPVKDSYTLKTAAIFGSNAGGKSNFVKAIELGKKLLLKGTRSGELIEYYPFRLNEGNDKKEYTSISYKILCNNKKYEYGFKYNSEQIKEEWLHIITRTSTHIVFNRNVDDSIFDISYLRKQNPKEEETQFLNFFAKSTPQRQLFLHEVLSRNIKDNVSNIEDLEAIINWFAFSLKIIFPDTQYKQGVLLKAVNDNDLKRGFGALLRYFNTGIDGVKLIDIEFDKLGIPQDIQHLIKNDLSKSKDDEAFGALQHDGNLILINYLDGDIHAKKLMTVHKKIEEKMGVELFSLADESDGTKRIFDYIPLILDLIQGEKVFVVDEIERSLHPAIVNQILYLFYKYSMNISSQLLFTTHESTLMDLKILRRDEIWFIKKDAKGISTIERMDKTFDVRFDKSLQNDYLNGIFGGTPQFGNEEEIKKLFLMLRKES